MAARVRNRPTRWRLQTAWRAPAAVAVIALAVAATAPAEPHPEPLSSVVRVLQEGVNGHVPEALVAATATRAALFSERGETITYRFVDSAGTELATWRAPRAHAPRLVCVGCPDPVVADARGYHAFSGDRWAPIDLGLPPPSLTDPFVSDAEGLLRSPATGRTVALVLDGTGQYLAVVDGGAAPALRPTGLRPGLGDRVAFTPDRRSDAREVSLSDVGDGLWLSVEPRGFPSRTEAVVRLADSRGVVAETTVAAARPISHRSTACTGRTADGRRAALLSSLSEPRTDDPSVEAREDSELLVWLDASLTVTSTVALHGFHDACALSPDGIAVLFTSVVAGVAAVDVTQVDATSLVRHKTVEVAADTMLTTILDPRAPLPTLSAWPLGAAAVNIDAALQTVRRPEIGGDQLVTDEAGGIWVSFARLGVVTRYRGSTS